MQANIMKTVFQPNIGKTMFATNKPIKEAIAVPINRSE